MKNIGIVAIAQGGVESVDQVSAQIGGLGVARDDGLAAGIDGDGAPGVSAVARHRETVGRRPHGIEPADVDVGRRPRAKARHQIGLASTVDCNAIAFIVESCRDGIGVHHRASICTEFDGKCVAPCHDHIACKKG